MKSLSQVRTLRITFISSIHPDWDILLPPFWNKLCTQINKPFSSGLRNKTANFSLLLKLASFLATTLLLKCKIKKKSTHHFFPNRASMCLKKWRCALWSKIIPPPRRKIIPLQLNKGIYKPADRKIRTLQKINKFKSLNLTLISILPYRIFSWGKYHVGVCVAHKSVCTTCKGFGSPFLSSSNGKKAHNNAQHSYGEAEMYKSRRGMYRWWYHLRTILLWCL